MADYKSNGATTTTEKKKGGKFKQNFRKFWWLHLLNFVVGTLLISLLLTYVGLPNIAQGDINKAEMQIDQQIITDPTPDSVQLRVVSKILNKSIFRPDLDSFNASLFLEDTMPNIKPFGQITIPGVHASKVVVTTVDQNMQILDQEQFERYNVLVAQSEKFRLAIRGRTRLHLGALPVVWVNFNKVVDLKGLNNFKGISVKDIKIDLVPDAEGNNMKGTIVIPNPSIMTLTIGDMVQEISAGGKVIGNSTIRNVVLRPGINEFPMVSAADQADVITILTKDPSRSGILSIEARAKSIVYNGKPLPYFQAAMSRTPVKLDLALKDALNAAGLGALLEPLPSGGGSGGGLGGTTTPSTPSTLPTRRRRSR